MNVDTQTPRSSQRVQVVGSFPPPVVGQALVTAKIVEELRQYGTVATFDWLPNFKSLIVRRCVKGILSFAAPFWVACNRLRGNRILYTIANHGFGLYYNLFVIWVGKSLGCRCVLHHHAVSYMTRDHRCMRLIGRAMGEQDCHVVLGPEMKRMLQERYANTTPIRILSNGFCIARADGHTNRTTINAGNRPEPKFVLGHLTNLSIDKGLDVVLEAFREMREEFPDIGLVVAGPTTDNASLALVRAAQLEFGDHFDYRGPVYGPAKQTFFDSIDVMLYPTRDDAQPLVVLESMSEGKPTIATSVGCIPSLVDNPEWLATSTDDFVQVAKMRIASWLHDPGEFQLAGARAQKTASKWIEQSEHSLAEFCTWMFSCNE